MPCQEPTNFWMDFAKIGSKIYVTQEMEWLDGENMNQWCVLRMEMQTENWFIMLGVETQKSCLHSFFMAMFKICCLKKWCFKRIQRISPNIHRKYINWGHLHVLKSHFCKFAYQPQRRKLILNTCRSHAESKGTPMHFPPRKIRPY